MPLETRIPFTLQDNASAIGNGTIIDVANLDELNIRIMGNGSGFIVNFEVSFDGTNFEAVTGYKGNDYSDATSATANSCWSIGVAPYIKFRARISAISSGNVTIKGDGK